MDLRSLFVYIKCFQLSGQVSDHHVRIQVCEQVSV